MTDVWTSRGKSYVLRDEETHSLKEHNGFPKMKLPKAAHTMRLWRIHDFPRDFRLEDVAGRGNS